MKLVLGCKKDDDLFELCKDFFGSERVEVINRHGNLNLDEIVIIISFAQLTNDIIFFLYTVLANRKYKKDTISQKKTENSKNTIFAEKQSFNEPEDNVTGKVIIDPHVSRRVVITKGGDINIDGYSIEEVTKMLQILLEE